MSRRILALVAYLFRSHLFSLAGLLYILLALVFYLIFFEPRQQTPDIDYYILVLGILGLTLSFLVTLTISARANRASHFPILVRLLSRIEYLSAVLITSILFATILQVLVALLALLANGPDLRLIDLLTIPPLWIAGNILFAVLALHATDLVTAGWSRVYVFAVLGLLLYLQSGMNVLGGWLSTLSNRIGGTLLARGMDSLASIFFDISLWFSGEEPTILVKILDLIFWPFTAITEASIRGSFTPLQALAPAVLLLYACLLFLLASRFFANKDLFFVE
jgi:hypothetical protein